jgi:hypothetical protein
MICGYAGSGAAIRRPDTYTGLHLPMNNTGTQFWDKTGKTITVNGGSVMSTTITHFIGPTGYFDGNGDFLEIEDSVDLEMGSGDYTWELWVYPTVDGDMQSLIGTTNDGYTASGGQIRRNSLKHPQFTFINTSVTPYVVIGTTTLEIGNWYHLAGVRYGNVLKLFVNGTQEGGDVACSGTQYDASAWYKVGIMSKKSGSTYYFPGYVSELRISKGIARYISNFTPPTRRR